MILGQDCYNIRHPFQFKKSEDKAAQRLMKSRIGRALGGPLQVKKAATLATTATSIAYEKFANQLSKWWNRVLRLKLWCHRKFKRVTTSTQDIRSNNAIHRWKIWSRTSVARKQSEVASLLLCNGTTQVPRTTPAEERNAKTALPRNHRHVNQHRLFS